MLFLGGAALAYGILSGDSLGYAALGPATLSLGGEVQQMANSYVDFGDRFVRLNDRDIELVRHFLAGAAEAISNRGWPADAVTDFRAFVAEWRDFGPGLYGTQFDRFVAGRPERHAYLAACLRAARERVLGFADEVPLHYLQKFAQPSGTIYFSGYPVRLIADALTQLEALVAGTVDGGNQTPPTHGDHV